jgi:hypothetical protein
MAPSLGASPMSEPEKSFNSPSIILRASPPSIAPSPQLGPLTDLPGTWVGTGFNVMWLPIFGGPATFRLKMNSTSEILTISEIGADIPNRGFLQPDLHFLGVHYLQQVSDATTHGQLHIEPGIWLNLPPNPPDPNPNVSFVARAATIPHGNALLAQGTTFDTVRPTFEMSDADTTPAGVPEAPGMLLSATLPREFPWGSAQNPNLILEWAVSKQTITKTVVIQVATDLATTPPSGGIDNIAFIESNAKPTRMSATFWIESVRQRDGSLTLQLQYSQKVLLRFGGTDWPHVSIATLVQQ